MSLVEVCHATIRIRSAYHGCFDFWRTSAEVPRCSRTTAWIGSDPKGGSRDVLEVSEVQS